MDALDCILSRRSIRRFKTEPVPQETIKKIVSYARFSPSWANTKTARYLCVSDKSVIEQVARLAPINNRRILLSAPQMVVISAVQGRAGGGWTWNYTPKEWTMFDSGIAAQTFCLAAHAHGVGTIVLGAYNLDELTAILPLPEEEMLIALIAMGYPDEMPVAPRRKTVEEILRFI